MSPTTPSSLGVRADPRLFDAADPRHSGAWTASTRWADFACYDDSPGRLELRYQREHGCADCTPAAQRATATLWAVD